VIWNNEIQFLFDLSDGEQKKIEEKKIEEKDEEI
jgi:hypothetical protein